MEWSVYCFCLVCMLVSLSVVNFNIRYNFWTVRDRDFIFGMHIQLMMPFGRWPCDLDFHHCANNSFFWLCCRWRHSVSQKHVFFFFLVDFYAPGWNNRGHIVFVLSFCLSVVNFNPRYSFWTVRGRDFIFGMHTLLMMPFQLTPRTMTLWPWFWPLR